MTLPPMTPFRARRNTKPPSPPALLPEHQRDVDQIAHHCSRMVTQRAIVSASAAIVPIPGLDLMVDVGMLTRMLEEINSEFGLTPMQIELLAKERRMSVYKAISSLDRSAVGRAITREVVALTIKQVAKRVATRSLARYVPIAGQAVAATLSCAALKYLGEQHIKDCVAVANRVIDLN
jgi:uncharacterized protein (DUF697 family)